MAYAVKKRASFEDLWKKPETVIDPTDEAAMRIAQAQRAAGRQVTPSAVYSAGGNTYHSREKTVEPGSATVVSAKEQTARQQEAMRAAMLQRARGEQPDTALTMPFTGGGATPVVPIEDIPVLYPSESGKAEVAQGTAQGSAKGGDKSTSITSDWSDILYELARQQMAINGQMPTGAPQTGGEWNDLYGQLVRQQMAGNADAAKNPPTGIGAGGGAWGQIYDQYAQQYMSLPDYQKPERIAGEGGTETWNDTLERLAREQIQNNNYMPYDPDTYDRMKATWMGKAEIAANVAAEQARQGAGGYGTSYASQIGANAYDASMQKSAADYYDQQKAAWERQRQINAQRLSIAGDMAARETAAQDRADAEALAEWQRQRQTAAERLSVAGSMADREQSEADRQAQAELAAWERQQALQNQNVAIAGEMADRETDAAQRDYENRVSEWERMRGASADNLAIAGDMAAWDIAQQQDAAEQAQDTEAAAVDRVQGLYQTLSQVYDGTNEATVRSQMRNAGYTDDEIESALSMVKNDMAAAVEDQARYSFGNQSIYDQMENAGIISKEQADSAKEMDSDNLTAALKRAVENPEMAAELLGMSEGEAASYNELPDENEKMAAILRIAGENVKAGRMSPYQFSQIIQPQIKERLQEIRDSAHYVRDVSDIVLLLKDYKDEGYLSSDQYGYALKKMAFDIDTQKANQNLAAHGEFRKMSDEQHQAWYEFLNYLNENPEW